MKPRKPLFAWLVFGMLFCLGLSAAGPIGPVKLKYGPSPSPRAVPLSQDASYFRGHWAQDFWALIPYYTAQQNDASCSVAAVVMVLNAARTGRSGAPSLTSDDKLISQAEVLEKVKTLQWKERVTLDSGLKTKGVHLEQISEIVQAAAEVYKLELAQAEILRPSSRAEIEKVLQQNEKNPDDFLIANFSQKSFTDDSEVGHFAPVGAYDSEKQRVLLLDPDRQWYEPYWVTVDTFLEGISTKDPINEGKSRGLLLLSFKGIKQQTPSAVASPLANPVAVPSALPVGQ